MLKYLIFAILMGLCLTQNETAVGEESMSESMDQMMNMSMSEISASQKNDSDPESSMTVTQTTVMPTPPMPTTTTTTTIPPETVQSMDNMMTISMSASEKNDTDPESSMRLSQTTVIPTTTMPTTTTTTTIPPETVQSMDNMMNISMSASEKNDTDPESSMRETQTTVIQTTLMPTTTTTTTAPPPTVPRETLAVAPNAVLTGEFGCTGLRSSDDIFGFQQFYKGVWLDKKCPLPLVWNQTECSCQARAVIIEDENCPHFRGLAGDITRYERRVHGVWLETPFTCPVNQIWSQPDCLCNWAPGGDLIPAAPALVRAGQCNALFNATFDVGIKDDSPNALSVGRTPWEAVSLAPTAAGSNNGAARVENGVLTLWFTGSNDFGSTFQFRTRFLLTEKQRTPDEKVVLLANAGCYGGRQTFSMSYTPSQQYHVFMRTTDNESTVSCSVPGNPYDWHTFGITYHEQLLTLTVDGTTCTTSDIFQGALVRTPCHMGLGGYNFDGFIDDAVMRKECVVPGEM